MVLLEPNLNQEAIRFHLQLPEFSFGAIGGDLKRLPQVQAKHLHEPLTVGGIASIGDPNREGAGSDQGHEILNILHTAESDVKFQDSRPLGLYKLPNLVYNERYGLPPTFFILHVIANRGLPRTFRSLAMTAYEVGATVHPASPFIRG